MCQFLSPIVVVTRMHCAAMFAHSTQISYLMMPLPWFGLVQILDFVSIIFLFRFLYFSLYFISQFSEDVDIISLKTSVTAGNKSTKGIAHPRPVIQPVLDRSTLNGACTGQ